MSSTSVDVLRFWFEQARPAQWWTKDPAFDDLIRSRFGATHEAAVRGELYTWRSGAEGRLAEVIVLDQFSRNLHRNTPRAFAADAMAVALAQEAVAGGHDQALAPERRAFLYMPFMHSESRMIHAYAAPLFEGLGMADTQRSAQQHRAIVERFGRYPHRNAALARESTAEELAFLREPGSSF